MWVLEVLGLDSSGVKRTKTVSPQALQTLNPWDVVVILSTACVHTQRTL